MYYHVIINPYRVVEHRGTIVPNLQREQLDERILQPYRQGRSITLGGATLPCSDVRQLRVLQTEDEVDNEKNLSRIGMKGRPFSGYSEDQLEALFTMLSKIGQDVTDKLVTGAPGHQRQADPVSTPEKGPAADARDVFVVHGRNEAARRALFTFLRSIGLDPREWSEAVTATGKPGPYIREIVEAAFSTAQAIVVLFTPDDEARLVKSLRKADDPVHEKELTGQARPNVLFEAGMAMAGSQDRTVLVELGVLRPFSDIDGIHKVRLNDTTQRRQDLAKRLQNAGCPVNLNGEDWHTAGDFEAALKSVEGSPESADGPVDGPDIVIDRQLSDEAEELLLEAVKDEEDGMLLINSTGGGFIIQTKSKLFNEQGDRRSTAKWEQAIAELRTQALIRNRGGLGRHFQVTQKGFEIADHLVSTP